MDLTSISASNQIAHQPRSVRYGDFHFLVGHEGLFVPQDTLPIDLGEE